MKLKVTPEMFAAMQELVDEGYLGAAALDIPELLHDWRVLSQRVAFLEARNAELEKVLEWYAGPAFVQFFSWARMRQPYPILDDQGQKARDVLNKK